MRFGAFDIWGVSSAVKFLSISVTLGFCVHYICGLHGTSLWGCWDSCPLSPASHPRSVKNKSCWRWGKDTWTHSLEPLPRASQGIWVGWKGKPGALGPDPESHSTTL